MFRKEPPSITIPEKPDSWDISDNSRKGLEWVKQYDENQVLMNNCYWSEAKGRIIFPVYYKDGNGEKKISAAWMRSPDTNLQPKWLFAGDKEALFFYKPVEDLDVEWRGDSEICLVEDVVSALKVGQVEECLALGGTYLKPHQLRFILRNGYRRVLIMLDGDKAGRDAALKIHRQLGLLIRMKNIVLKKDPKAHTINEIRELLDD